MTIEKAELPESDQLPGVEEPLVDREESARDTLSQSDAASENGGESESPRFRPLIGLAEQTFLAIIVALSLCALGGYYWTTHLRRGPWIEIEQAQPRPIQFQVDINRADWTELALLPGVGESLAQRIVDDREENGLYSDADQLTRVHGIGKTKLAAIREFLLPLNERESGEFAVSKNK